MNIRRLLGAGVIWLGMSVPAIASLVIKNVEITSLPALYKSDSGLQQRVWINIVHEGDVEPIVLQLGQVTKKVKLHSGENNFYIMHWIIVTLPIIIRSRQSFVGLVKFHGLSANI